jgi:hypothetical protein
MTVFVLPVVDVWGVVAGGVGAGAGVVGAGAGVEVGAGDAPPDEDEPDEDEPDEEAPPEDELEDAVVVVAGFGVVVVLGAAL